MVPAFLTLNNLFVTINIKLNKNIIEEIVSFRKLIYTVIPVYENDMKIDSDMI